MRYVSTRGGPQVQFPEVMLAGLAPGGGLYVPETWPRLEAAADASYADVLAQTLRLFVGEAIPDLGKLAAEVVAEFPPPDVVPLRQVEEDLYLLELFWGPSLAFKDLGLQVLARLFERAREPVTVIGATSGDTGAAAIQAFRGRAGVEVVVLHPRGRVSEVQRRQMTTVPDPNLYNVAVEGTFDDCQDLVKRLLQDEALHETRRLASANSINWFRIAAQAVYYIVAALRLGRPVDFSVPTGNFGNAYSGYVAARMGLGVGRIVVATNANRGLADLLQTGTLRVERAIPTSSPAMDIQLPSNLERALFEACGRDPEELARSMRSLTRDRTLTLSGSPLDHLRQIYRGEAVTAEETQDEIAGFYRGHDSLIDPHTAVGLAGARRHLTPGRVMVATATAHPGKFPDAVARATGVIPALPERFSKLFELPERLVHVPNDYDLVRKLVLEAGGSAGSIR